jgi:hypothetical protein
MVLLFESEGLYPAKGKRVNAGAIEPPEKDPADGCGAGNISDA